MEITIEEKAKAYDKAFARCRKLYDKAKERGETYEPERFEYIFPELAESEDKRNLRTLLEFLNALLGTGAETYLEKWNKNDCTDWIAWLENQGEQKPILDVEIPFGTDSELVEETITIPDGCYAIIEDNKVILRKGEKKSSWSEEDEMMIKFTLTYFRKAGATEDSDIIKWLKSLRPQNWTKEDKERYISCLQRLGTGNPEQPETINSKWFKEHVYSQNRWKPSATDIQVLEDVIDRGRNPINYHATLHGILEHLKKLREE